LTSVPRSDEIVTKVSPRSVTDTVARFLGIAAEKSVKVFATIDQREEAKRVGLELRETVLVVFGSPSTGTPVMSAHPLAALDLPLKILIWASAEETNVSYLSPDALATRYELSEELARPLAAIEVLTDALVAR
jgi:uncharacterized protein (DUF302 family)